VADDGSDGLDPATRQGHRFLRFALYWVEVAVHLAIWAAVARALGLSDALVIFGAFPAVVLATVASECLAGGSAVRRLAGLRVVDRHTGGRPRIGGSLLRQAGRFIGWAAAQTLVGMAIARGYEEAQRRGTGTQVVGRPTSGQALAVAGAGVAVAAVGCVLVQGHPIADHAWVMPAVVTVPFGVAGAAFALTAAASLRGQPGGGGDDLVSDLGLVGEAVAGDPGLRAAGMVAPVVGRGGYDPEPVPHARLDGTEAEVVGSAAPFVTRKRRRTGEVAPPP